MLMREQRMFASDFKIERAEKGPAKIVGYAARFNEVTEICGFFREKIAPGAFRECAEKDDVRALFNHDPNKVLGRTSNGTLRLSEDEVGLRYEITPPDTQEARDLMVLLERGDVSGSSFTFDMGAGDDEWDDDEAMPMRTIRRISSLYDVGPVTFPAYPTTSAGARSAEEIRADYEAARHDHEKNKSEARDQTLRLRRKRLDLVAL